MSSEQFQAAHSNIYNLGTHLLQYLQEIRQGRLSEGDDTKGLQSVENDIITALTALEKQKYQVAVIAAMKAGKSTFLNSIIGVDVLASETAACTICRTDVLHIPADQTPRLLEYREGERKPIVIAEGKEGEIQQKFLDRTREIRETGNPDNTIRFEIEHPIEAISGLSSLAGFTLVDTPGPNEWESAQFNTVELKRTALEALRTCNAILFVLNYASYKDNAIADLFKDIVENRQEILESDKGKIYFILNKVDQKTEKDKDIDEVIQDLKRELSNFGFPNPMIYRASSRQGLLAKLIQQGKATESQKKDFKKFFSARYATENEEGDQVIPAPHKIAPQALIDSGIPEIQSTVIETITKNAGWNLLSDALAKIDKAEKTIESLLNAQIGGWNTKLEELKQIVEEYRIRSESAKKKVEIVKESVNNKEKELINRFNQGITEFTEGAKSKIQDEIDRIANPRINKSTNSEVNQKTEIPTRIEIPSNDMNLALTLPNTVPVLGGFSFSFRVQRPLIDAVNQVLNRGSSNFKDSQSQLDDSYIIRVNTDKEAEEIIKTINEFCTPLIRTWWVDTQDRLVRDGTKIREELVQKIQNSIQNISNDLSNYLGEALQVEINLNPIQFPSFEFSGIDAQVKYQQAIYEKKRGQDTRTGEKPGFCEDKDDYVKRTTKPNFFHEINLRSTSEAIKLNIDNKASASRQLLERAIENQIADDFRKAEQQINDYITKFQDEFDRLLKERETKEAESDEIVNTLNFQKENLNEYIQELKSIRESLNTWKP
ncbi:dynamin family protein [Anabaena sp. UHCC 0187]|uniref:dynamin family protein n=1 Tax=Anabaena sp. UHCC 0187 TaxID=2590018 RepID=UPI001446C296|nr:dynamin family protein [Anabaena sp. UHCC 0187]MTJ15277.1 dynamin family protein [Anabaena sp. UHCC 0187]